MSGFSVCTFRYVLVWFAFLVYVYMSHRLGHSLYGRFGVCNTEGLVYTYCLALPHNFYSRFGLCNIACISYCLALPHIIGLVYVTFLEKLLLGPSPYSRLGLCNIACISYCMALPHIVGLVCVALSV